MAFKGKDGGTWKDASAVYGKLNGSWLYGKSAWAKKDGSWQRAWTDCRRHDEGGRDWTTTTETETTTDTSACDSCGSRTGTRTRTRYEKTGCTTYYSAWSDWSYGSCSGSWSAATGNKVVDGLDLVYDGTPGYYTVMLTGPSESFYGCGPCSSSGCYDMGHYYVESCSVGGLRVTKLSCEGCVSFFDGSPC